MLVLNATPLIYLAKAGKLHHLSVLPHTPVLPASVHHEVVEKGKERGEPDAERIQNLVEKDALDVQTTPDTTLNKKLQDNDHLHKAERDVIVLADSTDGTAILDEKYGRTVAEAENVDHGGTVFLLLQLVQHDIITPDKMRTTIDQIIDHGWYCSPQLYTKIIHTIETLE